ncbi:hypothetical protein NHX12_032949 [Muraenolepis orangiensis]|uniref:Uncharacterized protein n=1 Tax=Muraenolepis orangiensis TaxID=630683 RepID=A0A9Q0E2H3_9TELE|nr:hypothetical protein NHX12_032949 [Muraenolepis orangiensis]
MSFDGERQEMDLDLLFALETKRVFVMVFPLFCWYSNQSDKSLDPISCRLPIPISVQALAALYSPNPQVTYPQNDFRR